MAYLNNRKRVTAVHKANIMEKVDGEFLKAIREVAQRYPSIEYKEMIVDNASMQMTSNPWQFMLWFYLIFMGRSWQILSHVQLEDQGYPRGEY